MHPSLTIKIFKIPIHSFHFFGAIGFFLGLLLGVSLAYATDIAVWPVLLCSLTGVGVLFGLTWLYKVITGREDLVYYQHEISIIICCLILLALLKEPVLKYLDITLMGIGVFLVFGRIGCFSVGCCHGRIGRKGVKYTNAHAEEGFQKSFVGIPIFPIQLVESVCVLVIVVIGSYAILNKFLPGTALLLYTVIYGFVRFILEYYRGDIERPYWKGFSEAQWTTLGIFVISVVLSLSGLLPHYLSHLLALPALVFIMLANVIFRKFQTVPTHKILHPTHVLEIAQGLDALENYVSINGKINIIETSMGLRISRGIVHLENSNVDHYTLSVKRLYSEINTKPEFQMEMKCAKIFGKLLQTLKYPSTEFEIKDGGPGIFHFIFPLYENANENIQESMPHFIKAPMFTNQQTENTYYPEVSEDSEEKE